MLTSAVIDTRATAVRQWRSAGFRLICQAAAGMEFRDASDWHSKSDRAKLSAPLTHEMNIPASTHVLRFGVFELDNTSGELRRHGLKIRLPEQSVQILKTLLGRPGEVVTRDELRRVLWTSETFV